jgi:hypothetical protein
MKKKANNSNKNTNIVVNFNSNSDKEINKFLKSLNLSAVRVSNLFSRWAIDVPFWKEDYFAQKLSESEIVEKIYRNPTGKRTYDNTQKKEVGDE